VKTYIKTYRLVVRKINNNIVLYTIEIALKQLYSKNKKNSVSITKLYALCTKQLRFSILLILSVISHVHAEHIEQHFLRMTQEQQRSKEMILLAHNGQSPGTSCKLCPPLINYTLQFNYMFYIQVIKAQALHPLQKLLQKYVTFNIVTNTCMPIFCACVCH